VCKTDALPLSYPPKRERLMAQDGGRVQGKK
jgi:hypothetical protein